MTKRGYTHAQVFLPEIFSLPRRKEVKPSVKYLVIYRHRKEYAVSTMCDFFGGSCSGYYGLVSRMDVPAKDLPLAEND